MAHLRSGARLGPFLLTERLGGGAAAEVWEARYVASPPPMEPHGPVEHGSTERASLVLGSLMDHPLRALKILVPVIDHADEQESMFRDEAELAVRLIHPNIVRTYGLLEIEGLLIQVMDAEKGLDLEAALRRLRGPLEPWYVGAYVLREVAKGMAFAHALTDENAESLEIVHRDLTPSNIFVGDDGSVKVLDFGIAWKKDRRVLTQTGFVKGKSSYVAPEVYGDGTFDHRADIFTLGVAVAKMLLPHDERNRRGTPARRGSSELSQRTDIPSSFLSLLRRMLHGNPRERPASMDLIAAEAQSLLDAEGIDDATASLALVSRLVRPSSLAGDMGSRRLGPQPPKSTAVKPRPKRSAPSSKIPFDGPQAQTVLEPLQNTLKVDPEATQHAPLPSRTPSVDGSAVGVGDLVADRFQILAPTRAEPPLRGFLARRVDALYEQIDLRLVPLPHGPEGFIAQAQALASLKSPHAVRLLEHDVVSGMGYLAFEMIPGRTLSEALQDEPRTPNEGVYAVRDAARALLDAHARGIVHGDLRPSNIQLFEADGRAFARLDFATTRRLFPSLSRRLPRELDALPLSAYASPEQCQGLPPSISSDIYGLGLLLYYALVGEHPFQAHLASEERSRYAHLHMRLPPFGLESATGAEATRLLRQLLDKDPRNRPSSLADVIALIDRILEPPRIADEQTSIDPLDGADTLDGPLHTRPVNLEDIPKLAIPESTTQPCDGPPRRSHRLWIYLTVALALVLAGGATVVQATSFALP